MYKTKSSVERFNIIFFYFKITAVLNILNTANERFIMRFIQVTQL